MEQEIFCDECRYYDYSINTGYNERCIHKNNINSIEIKNYHSKCKGIGYIRSPGEINKNNDCKWFKNRGLLYFIINFFS